MSAKLTNARMWAFDSILVRLKSVLIFHPRGFCGTDSKPDGHGLIFQVQMGRSRGAEDAALPSQENPGERRVLGPTEYCEWLCSEVTVTGLRVHSKEALP